MDNDEREAQRRVDQACRLIASAYRLYPLDPKRTVSHVQSAISMGAEQMAEDITEEAFTCGR